MCLRPRSCLSVPLCSFPAPLNSTLLSPRRCSSSPPPSPRSARWDCRALAQSQEGDVLDLRRFAMNTVKDRGNAWQPIRRQLLLPVFFLTATCTWREHLCHQHLYWGVFIYSRYELKQLVSRLKINLNSFANKLIFQTSFKKKCQTSAGSSFFNLLSFSVLQHFKWNVFGIWTAAWTKPAMWRHFLGLWETVMGNFSLHCLIKLIGRLIDGYNR